MEVSLAKVHVYLSAFRIRPFTHILRKARCTRAEDCLLQGLLRAEKTLAKNTLKSLLGQAKGSPMVPLNAEMFLDVLISGGTGGHPTPLGLTRDSSQQYSHRSQISM